MSAVSLAILPISCFINGSNSILDPNFFPTRNISTALLPTLQHSASTNQFWSQMIPLTCTFVIGLIFLGVDSLGELLEGKIGWSIRFLITLVNFCVAAVATSRYDNLRNHMEIDAWYLKEKDNSYSFAQVMSLALLGSSIIPLFKSFIEMIDGPRSQAMATLAAVQRSAKQFEGSGDDANPMPPNYNDSYAYDG